MNNLEKYDNLENKFDVIVIGGGATGLGVAVESISRGYKTLLIEAYDFGKGTSSKSTKLVHGGIRYLANFDFELVKEGLSERQYFLANAPHLAHKQSYLIPFYSKWDRIKYFIGVKLYDFLAKNKKIGKSKLLSKTEIIKIAPNLIQDKLIGGVVYYDGQFDDTRMLISLLNTFKDLGGIAYNYQKVTGFIKDNDNNKVIGVKTVKTLKYTDRFGSGDGANNDSIPHANQINSNSNINQNNESIYPPINFYATVIINATGTLTDTILNLDEPEIKHEHVTAAQGTHLVFKKDVFDCNSAFVIPKTLDNRIIFILPWYEDKIIVGTTDIMVDHAEIEPTATVEEVEFIIETLNQYTKNKVTVDDICSIFAGQRPLVTPNNPKNNSGHNSMHDSINDSTTGKISRKHEILLSKSGIVSIVGGKWTIYRLMGEDTLNFIVKHGLLPQHISSEMMDTNNLQTKYLSLHGSHDYFKNLGNMHNSQSLHNLQNINLTQYPLSVYGTYANKIVEIQREKNDFSKLHDQLPYYSAEVIYHIRYEMAETVEDVLARRTHAILIDAKSSIESCEKVARIIAEELKKSELWIEAQIKEFNLFARKYLYTELPIKT